MDATIQTELPSAKAEIFSPTSVAEASEKLVAQGQHIAAIRFLREALRIGYVLEPQIWSAGCHVFDDFGVTTSSFEYSGAAKTMKASRTVTIMSAFYSA